MVGGEKRLLTEKEKALVISVPFMEDTVNDIEAVAVFPEQEPVRTEPESTGQERADPRGRL